MQPGDDLEVSQLGPEANGLYRKLRGKAETIAYCEFTLQAFAGVSGRPQR